MQVWIKISMDNAAFADDRESEAAWILKGIAQDIENGLSLEPGHDVPLRDNNGNKVGFMGVYDKPHIIALEGE